MDLGLEEEAFGIANQFPKLGSVMLSFLRHEILDFMVTELPFFKYIYYVFIYLGS